MYIRDLPYKEKCSICLILHSNNCYYELGLKMGFQEEFLKNLSEGCKKNDALIARLLDEWDIYGHSVMDLFIVLYRLKQYQAMKHLKPFVDPKHHFRIKEAPQNPKTEKVLNAPPELSLAVSRDDNLTTPLLNNLKPKPPSPRINSDASSMMESAGTIPHIPYEELQASTNNWDSGNILGKGGFGTVFKGTLKNTDVAIKRIEKRDDSPDGYQQVVQSNTELHCLNAYRQDNILTLYGFSFGGPQPCLIYQFMSGGSLESRLHIRDPSKVLTWTSRLNISIGTACGLQYLHTIRSNPLIHGDIKSANILLDSTDNPRIGDFGLAREGPASDYIKVTRIHGTRPYLPDEFMRHKKFSTKVDTYSFGVVLFELATGARAYCNKRKDKFLRDYVVNYEVEKIVELKDERASGGEDYFCKIVNIGKECVLSNAKSRPEMVEVWQKLRSN